ncbi:MAG: phosphoribosyltransferase family protein [Chloroflexota bacterium]
MPLSHGPVAFADRHDAGRQLAAALAEYRNQPVVVLAIPNGGVPVALEVAIVLQAELGLVISRKIPLPLSPEAGFGAVTDDGAVILNDDLVKRAGLTPHQVNYQVSKVRADIRQRTLLYQRDRPLSRVTDKTVIIVDDGLATGYTMMAAVESVRRRHPRKVIAAAPVGSAAAVKELAKTADRVVTVVTGYMPGFSVAGFYGNWYDPSDNEVLQCLKEWEVRRYHPDMELPPDRRPAQPMDGHD